MFGFKTKKDKRIEELEQALLSLHYKTPTVIKSERNVVCLGASCVLDDHMPVEYAKDMLSCDMLSSIKNCMSYDLEELNGNKILKGYLNVMI